MLYIDLRPGQICHSKVMHRKEVTHSDGSYEKKSRRRAWLTIWNKVKSHSTLIDWCTGKEWRRNCMTVISAWWRLNIPFQRLSGRLKYYITRWWQEVSELEYKEVEDKMRSGPLCPQLSSSRERERNTVRVNRMRVNMLQFCSVSNSLSHMNLSNKVRGIYFFKEVFARLCSLRQDVFCTYMGIVVAYDYTTIILLSIFFEVNSPFHRFPNFSLFAFFSVHFKGFLLIPSLFLNIIGKRPLPQVSSCMLLDKS